MNDGLGIFIDQIKYFVRIAKKVMVTPCALSRHMRGLLPTIQFRSSENERRSRYDSWSEECSHFHVVPLSWAHDVILMGYYLIRDR